MTEEIIVNINPEVRAAFTTLEHPLPTLGPDLGNGTNTVSLTGLTIGQTYVVRGVGGTLTGATLDGNALVVNTNRRATSFKASATSHTVARTAGTATSLTVQQITAPAPIPPQFEGVSLRGTLKEEGITSNFTVGGSSSQQYATDATTSTAIGFMAQENLTTGQNNTAIGGQAQRNLTTGRGNTAAGVGAQQNLVDGRFNTSFGLGAGAAYVQGNWNLSLGAVAGNTNQADVNGSVQIGTDNTGVGAFTTADNQIALGTTLHTMKCGAVNGETGFWALGVAKAGTPSAPASPTYLTVKVDGTVYDIPVGPAGGSGIQPTIVDAKGDLIVGTGADTVARLPVSGNNGRVLTEDSTTAEGMRWAAIPAPTRWALRQAQATIPAASFNYVGATSMQWDLVFTLEALPPGQQVTYWTQSGTLGAVQSSGSHNVNVQILAAGGTLFSQNFNSTGIWTTTSVHGMRIAWRADDGTGIPDVRLWTSADSGATWTLRHTWTTNAPASIGNATNTLGFGPPFPGSVVSASVVRNGSEVASWRADHARGPRDSDPYGNVWTLGGTTYSWRTL